MAALELYVYYRLPADQRATWPARVESLHHELAVAMPGLHARLLRRADESVALAQDPSPAAAESPPDTWMEVYHRAVVGLDHRMIEYIESAARGRLAPWIQGTRHAEVFHAA
jgi:hypothetical protein